MLPVQTPIDLPVVLADEALHINLCDMLHREDGVMQVTEQITVIHVRLDHGQT